jgi:uncharacterized protein (TIGR03546 family)
MFTGFLPFFSLHTLLLLLIVLLVRVNLSAFLLGTAFFSGLAFLLDPLFHRVGLAVLSLGSLNSLWTAMYSSTIWRIERFNNSVVMGSFLVAVILFVPLLLLLNLAIRRYRDHVLAWVRKTRLMQAFTASKMFALYQKVSGWEE